MKHLLLCLLLVASVLPARSQWIGAVEDTITHNALREETRRQSLAIDDNNTIHLLYVRDTGGAWELVYHKRPNNSAWGPEESVTTATVANAALAVDRASGHAYAVWEQPGITGTDILLGEETGGV